MSSLVEHEAGNGGSVRRWAHVQGHCLVVQSSKGCDIYTTGGWDLRASPRALAAIELFTAAAAEKRREQRRVLSRVEDWEHDAHEDLRFQAQG